MPRVAPTRWLGDVSACSGPLCAQAASAEAAVPVFRRFDLVVGGGAARLMDSVSSWRSERRLDLRYTANTLALWAGAVRVDGRRSDTVSALRARFESGIRYTTTRAEIALNVSAGRRISQSAIATIANTHASDSGAVVRVDTVPSDPGATRSELVSLAELRASWSVGRFLFSTVAGRGAARSIAPMYWGSVEAATPLRRGPFAFLNVGFAATPGTAGFIGIPKRSLSAGLRFSSATFATRAADRSAGAASASMFTVQRESMGQYRLRVRLPNAQRVELASDCTAWTPVALSRRDDKVWEIVLPVSAGSHLVNIRVDGGTWIAPPGLVATTDDFEGVVGVFVVD